jgi:hypothetical protein
MNPYNSNWREVRYTVVYDDGTEIVRGSALVELSAPGYSVVDRSGYSYLYDQWVAEIEALVKDGKAVWK